MVQRVERNAVGLALAFAVVSAGPARAIEDEAPDPYAAREGERPFNELELENFTVRVGAGFLFDVAGYDQDPASARQLNLRSGWRLRDFRLLLNGRLGPGPRLTYSLGYMYDGNSDSWRFRQTGITLELPELWGRVFVGRSKEGISVSKIMVGYNGWGIERVTANDALVPILADGVKWIGHTPDGSMVWNLGWYTDVVSEIETFNRNDMAVTGRVAVVPWHQQSGNDTVLYVGVAGRYALANDGFLTYTSKPESSPTDQFVIETGTFAAQHSVTAQAEAYYQPGSLTLGTEYFLHQVDSSETGNPFFHGGELFLAYLLTGETRRYNTRGGFFEGVVPAHSIFEKGPGAWELVTRLSYSDFDDAEIRGGRFWRVTPMINWHATKNIRLAVAYGYGVLFRDDLRGGTHFLDGRLQLKL